MRILSNDRVWTAVAAIAAMVSAIFAAMAVYQTGRIWEYQYEAERPYFTLEKPSIGETHREPPYEVSKSPKNIGGRPATNFIGKVLMIERPFDRGPYFTTTFALANDMSPGMLSTWHQDIKAMPSEVPFQYVVISMRYSDALTEQEYEQVFYLTWPGLKAGRGSTALTHTSAQTSEELNGHLGASLFDYSK